jgi:hypothetical protein
MSRKTKGERLERVVDYTLAAIVIGLAFAFIWALGTAFAHGAGWLIIPCALVLAVIAIIATYIETGTDTYK